MANQHLQVHSALIANRNSYMVLYAFEFIQIKKMLMIKKHEKVKAIYCPTSKLKLLKGKMKAVSNCFAHK